MRVEGAGQGAGRAADGAAAREAPRAFDEALARAGGRRAQPAQRGERRRRAAIAGEDGRGPGARPLHVLAAPREAPRVGRMLAPEAIARVAIAAARVDGREAVELRFGADLLVRLTRTPRGVELLLDPAAGARAAAAAELPGLVAALRAHGVALAAAQVRPAAPGPPVVGPVPGGRRDGALTGRRPSGTKPATRDPGGTVAKW